VGRPSPTSDPKSVERQKEMAVRFAMGASRFRVIRQMLVEHVVLFLGGAAGSALVALYITRWITASIPYEVTLDDWIEQNAVGDFDHLLIGSSRRG